MKTFRYLTLLFAVAWLLMPAARAQNAETKTKLAEIRKAYANAMKLEEEGKSGTNKNYQTFRAVQSNPNGTWERKLDFVVDPSGYIEELDLYYPILRFVRETSGTTVQEFLYDEEGNLLFVFTRNKYEEDGPIVEERYYYGEGGSFWKIVKEVDPKTGKVRSETAGATEEADGTALFMGRVAADHYHAFETLNMIYD